LIFGSAIVRVTGEKKTTAMPEKMFDKKTLTIYRLIILFSMRQRRKNKAAKLQVSQSMSLSMYTSFDLAFHIPSAATWQ
jgi:hypothetical protein